MTKQKSKDVTFHTYKPKNLIDVMVGIPEFVMVYQLQKTKGKLKRGILLVMPSLHRFFTIRRWYSESRKENLNVSAEDETQVKFYGYFQKRGAPIPGVPYLWNLKERPYALL